MKKLLIMVPKKGKMKKALVAYLDQTLNRSSPGRVQVSLGRLSDLVFEIKRKDVRVKLNGRQITDFDLVYIRRATGEFLSLAGSLATSLDYLRIEYFDSVFREIGPAGDKLNAMIKLSLAGLPIIPSFFCWRDKIDSQMNTIIKKFDLPLVAKERSRQRGEGVFLIEKRKDFSLLEKTPSSDQFLFQEFLESKEEYRLVIMGDKPNVFYRKLPKKGEFRGNTALGAKEEYLDVGEAPKEMKKIAIKAAKVLDLQIAGVDILVDKRGKLWLLEVNRGPGFTYDTKISTELPALASFFAKKLRVEK